MSTTYPMAPLIRGTLLTLYLALALPLPLLATGLARTAMVLATLLGFLLVLAATSERVRLDEEALSVGHPPWCAWLLRRGWRLEWGTIRSLKPMATSQGGRVYYVGSNDGALHLLPQRIAGFPAFLACFQARTGLSTAAVGRLTPAWTYQLLAVLSGALLLAELGGWALAQSGGLQLAPAG
ncbi:MAG: hypothetical protein WCK64_03740 [Synechococcaceae cyanobacterium ELA445]|jgi:hypothetical protein